MKHLGHFPHQNSYKLLWNPLHTGGQLQFLLALMYVLDVHPLSMFVDLSFSEALKDWFGYELSW